MERRPIPQERINAIREYQQAQEPIVMDAETLEEIQAQAPTLNEMFESMYADFTFDASVEP